MTAFFRRLSRGSLAVVVAAGSVAALLVVGVGSSRDASDPARVTLISRQQAADALREFVPADMQFEVTGPRDGATHWYYEAQGPDMSAAVDAHDGRVTSLTLLKLVPAGAEVAIKPADAQAAAVRFLSGHRIDFRALAVAVSTMDHGDSAEYVVTFQRTSNGARVPDTRIVSVDPATGNVFSFVDDRRPYQDPPPARIGREDAVARAAAAAGVNGAEPLRTELRVEFDRDGTQQLVWEIELSAASGQGYVSYAAVKVDALTGEASVVGRG